MDYQHGLSEEEITEELKRYDFQPIILEKGGVVLKEVHDIPPFEDVSLRLMDKNVKFRQGTNKFEFDINKFNLGERTTLEKETGLNIQEGGQYLVTVGNDFKVKKSFAAQVIQELQKGENYLLAYLCRSYKISVKNRKSSVFLKFTTDDAHGKVKQKVSESFVHLNTPRNGDFYTQTQKVLLDFYLLNLQIGDQGNYLKVTVDQHEFNINKWKAYSISGLSLGEHKITVQAYNKNNEKITGKLLKPITVSFTVNEENVFE